MQHDETIQEGKNTSLSLLLFSSSKDEPDTMGGYTEIDGDGVKSTGTTLMQKFRGLIDNFTATQKRVVLTVCIVMLFVLTPALLFKDFLKYASNISASYRAERSSRYGQTEERMMHTFRQQIMLDPVYIELYSPDGHDITQSPYVENIKIITQILYLETVQGELQSFFTSIWGFYARQQLYPALDPDILHCCANTSTLIVAGVHGLTPYSLVQNPMVQMLQVLVPPTTGLQFRFTSVVQQVEDMKNSAVKDLGMIDLISIPCALVALVLCVKSARLLVIPLISVATGILITFIVLEPYSMHEISSPIGPPVVAATVVALSLDFNLFILARYCDKRRATVEGLKLRKQLTARSPTWSDVTPPESFAAAGERIRLNQQGQQPRSYFATYNKERRFRSADIWSTLSNSGYSAGGKGRQSEDDDAMMYLPWEVRWRLVQSTIISCSKNIVYSGITISLVFLTMALSKFTTVRTVSIGSAAGASVCVVNSLILSGSLLFLLDPALMGPCAAATHFSTWYAGRKTKFMGCMTLWMDMVRAVCTRKDAKAGTARNHRDEVATISTEEGQSAFHNVRSPLLSGEVVSDPTSEEDVQTPGAPVATATSPSSASTALLPTWLRRQRASFWFRIGCFAHTRPKSVVLICLLILVLPAIALKDIRIGFNIYTEVPVGTEHIEKYKGVVGRYGSSVSAPFYIYLSNELRERSLFVPSDVPIPSHHPTPEPKPPRNHTNGTNTSTLTSTASASLSETLYEGTPAPTHVKSDVYTYNDTVKFTRLLADITQHLLDQIYEGYYSTSGGISRKKASPTTPLMGPVVSLSLLPTQPQPNGQDGSSPSNYTPANITYLDTPEDVLLEYEMSAEYRKTFQLLSNSNNHNIKYGYFYASDVVIAVYTNQNPYGDVGEQVCHMMRDLVASFGPRAKDIGPKGVFIGWYGPNGDSCNVLREAYARLPLELGLVALAAFSAMSVAFHSLVISLRMVATVGYTAVFSFGIATFIFCDTVLHQSIFTQLQLTSSFTWIIPVLVLPFIVALALDYDAFLLTRVAELRIKGFTNEASVCKAVYRTGRVISYAGVIMSFAFGSLIFSSAIMLRQWGTIIFCGVLCDAFLVRPLLVPALMALFPNFLWFPRCGLKDPIYGMDDDDDVRIDSHEGEQAEEEGQEEGKDAA